MTSENFIRMIIVAFGSYAAILESDGTLTVMEKSKQKRLEEDDFFL